MRPFWSWKKPAARTAVGRARLSFWLLIVVAVLAIGSLSSALGAPAGPVTGLRVAVSGVVLIAALTLSSRVLIALDRARRRIPAVTPTGTNRG